MCCRLVADAAIPLLHQGQHLLLTSRHWCHLLLGCPLAVGGLSTVLPPSWLRLFSPSELNQLISGGLDTGLDVDDMAK
jgi:hypothetical protein